MTMNVFVLAPILGCVSEAVCCKIPEAVRASVCVCVCMRERERQTDRQTDRQRAFEGVEYV